MNTLPTTVTPIDGLFVGAGTIEAIPGGVDQVMAVARFQYDGYITTLLDNNLHDLETLRASIERAERKDASDVRMFDSDAPGALLLRGIEGPVDYIDLVNIIRDLRLGLARRRTELT
jgi:hypothetical protein